ncbi:MAG: YdcF family protein [Paracoccaceae bacterium]
MINLVKRITITALLVYAFSLFGVFYSATNYLKNYADGQHLPRSTGVAVVLGSTTRGDGVLDYAARRRVALGVRLLQEGRAGYLITSGMAPGFRPESNGEAMAQYAISLGAPANAVAVESNATSTFENLLYARDIATAEGREITVIVTDAFHMPRAAFLARLIGLEDIGLAAVATPASVQGEMGLYPLAREALAWWVNFARLGVWYLNGQRWPL